MQLSASSPRNPKTTYSEGTQAAYIDKKIVKLYDKLQSSIGHGIDFAKRKSQKPFRPSHSKYVNLPEYRVCWHYGFTGQFRHSCPEIGYTWRGDPSNIECNVKVPTSKPKKK